jgi:hypothetical protein
MQQLARALEFFAPRSGPKHITVQSKEKTRRYEPADSLAFRIAPQKHKRRLSGMIARRRRYFPAACRDRDVAAGFLFRLLWDGSQTPIES